MCANKSKIKKEKKNIKSQREFSKNRKKYIKRYIVLKWQGLASLCHRVSNVAKALTQQMMYSIKHKIKQ